MPKALEPGPNWEENVTPKGEYQTESIGGPLISDRTMRGLHDKWMKNQLKPLLQVAKLSHSIQFPLVLLDTLRREANQRQVRVNDLILERLQSSVADNQIIGTAMVYGFQKLAQKYDRDWKVLMQDALIQFLEDNGVDESILASARYVKKEQK